MAAVVVTVGVCNCPKWRKEKKACFSNKLYLCPFHKTTTTTPTTAKTSALESGAVRMCKTAQGRGMAGQIISAQLHADVQPVPAAVDTANAKCVNDFTVCRRNCKSSLWWKHDTPKRLSYFEAPCKPKPAELATRVSLGIILIKLPHCKFDLGCSASHPIRPRNIYKYIYI